MIHSVAKDISMSLKISELNFLELKQALNKD